MNVDPARIFSLKEFQLRWLKQRKISQVNDEIEVINTGVTSDPLTGRLDYFWFHIHRTIGTEESFGFQVVRIIELNAIPLNARADAGLLQKMRTILRSLYGAEVNFIYLAAGIFQPPLGITQCYGVTAFCNELEEAIKQTSMNISVLRSCLAAAYQQIQLASPNLQTGEWLYRAFDELKFATITVGQPDPRENVRSDASPLLTNPLLQENGQSAQYSMQQNELMFRGMSHLQEDFLFLVLTSPVSLLDISYMLTGLAEESSVWASTQQGVRGISYGISIPAILSGALIQNVNQGYNSGGGRIRNVRQFTYRRDCSNTGGSSYRRNS